MRGSDIAAESDRQDFPEVGHWNERGEKERERKIILLHVTENVGIDMMYNYSYSDSDVLILYEICMERIKSLYCDAILITVLFFIINWIAICNINPRKKSYICSNYMYDIYF